MAYKVHHEGGGLGYNVQTLNIEAWIVECGLCKHCGCRPGNCYISLVTVTPDYTSLVTCMQKQEIKFDVSPVPSAGEPG